MNEFPLNTYSPEPNGGCWNWLLGKTNGYGVYKYQGKQVYVHRLSAHIYYDMPLDSDMHVLHKCNNRSCINPDHIYLGTDLENARDRVAAGTAINGNTNRMVCQRGHPIMGDNCGYDCRGDRFCRQCRRDKERARGPRNRSAKAKAKIAEEDARHNPTQ